jgi:hypothetical protein
MDWQGQRCQMTMTSVLGHLLACDFPPQYKQWTQCDPVELFTTPIHWSVPPVSYNENTVHRYFLKNNTIELHNYILKPMISGISKSNTTFEISG